MKTWEMIKALTENPKLKFNNGIHKVKISDITNRIVWDYADEKEDPFIMFSNAPGAIDNLHIEWELIPQEVTWQEAIQAWVDGREVYFTLNGSVRLYLDDCSHYLRTLAQCRPISKDEILKGKWYIES